MKFHFDDDDDDGDVHALAGVNGRVHGSVAASAATTLNKPRHSRFRAPSTDSSTDSSDEDARDHEDDDDTRALSPSMSSMGISLLTNKSRQGVYDDVLGLLVVVVDES